MFSSSLNDFYIKQTYTSPSSAPFHRIENSLGWRSKSLKTCIIECQILFKYRCTYAPVYQQVGSIPIQTTEEGNKL